MNLRHVAALSAALLPCAASAQEATEFSYGARIASDYYSDGESLSDGNPVLQAYGEVARGPFYGGVWASTIDVEPDILEFELAVGVRPVFGELELNLSYARTLYDETGDCCGEFILFAEYPFSDTITAGGGLSYDPDSRETWFEVVNGVELDENWSVSGAIGTDFGTDEDEDGNTISWDIGLVRRLGDQVYGDARYYDSSIGSGAVVVSVGFDF